jgi:hypothetical protein
VQDAEGLAYALVSVWHQVFKSNHSRKHICLLGQRSRCQMPARQHFLYFSARGLNRAGLFSVESIYSGSFPLLHDFDRIDDGERVDTACDFMIRAVYIGH